ncbi:MAG: hypothetical protein ABIR34_10085 [Marmoricola sp.]
MSAPGCWGYLGHTGGFGDSHIDTAARLPTGVSMTGLDLHS